MSNYEQFKNREANILTAVLVAVVVVMGVIAFTVMAHV